MLILVVLTLVLSFIGCSYDNDNGDDEPNYVFEPKEDYPVVDFSSVSTVYLWTLDEEYPLEQDGNKWTGDFNLSPGTNYWLLASDGANVFSIPSIITIDSFLVAGREDRDGEVGSFSWVSNLDKAIFTHQAITGMLDTEHAESCLGDENLQDFYVEDAKIEKDGEDKGIDDIVDYFFEREVEIDVEDDAEALFYAVGDFGYEAELEGEGSFLVTDEDGELRKEGYTLTYENDKWKISDLETYEMDYIAVTENNEENEEDESYKIYLDIVSAVEKNKDFDNEPEEYEEIALVGTFEWDTDDTDFRYDEEDSELNRDGDVFELEIDDEDDINLLENQLFVIVAIAEDGKESYVPSGIGGERNFERWAEITKDSIE